MARHLFEHHPPNLLMIHLVEVDHVGHRHGPRTPEAYWSVSYADDRIRDLVEASRLSPYGDKTTFVIASDHGFFPIEKDIAPNIVLRKAGLIEVQEGKVASKAAWCVSQGGACMVYVLDDARRQEIVALLKRELAALEGVQAVLSPEEFARIGQPTPLDDPRAPDLWLSAESGYNFSESHTGDEAVARRSAPGGTHGYLPDQPDMLGSLVIWGHGVKRGARLGKRESIDVAPTMAALLGVDLPTAEGKAIAPALEK
jgi:predicted AlkP superfamily pyrophosphatase or phosphodiesterase